MTAPQKPATPSLPDPKEVAKTYGEIAQRASKLIQDHIQRQLKKASLPRQMSWVLPRPSWT